MKYKDLDIKKVKECCKRHAQKQIKGKPIFNCDNCPLRRTNDRGNTSFCWFRLDKFYEDCEQEHEELKKEELCHEDEWLKYLLESEE